jgi:acetoin utilization protein AcuB
MHEGTVAQFMTRSPVTIGPEESLATAHRKMRAHRVRHLPVVRRGKLVGLVSMGDLHLIETLVGVTPLGAHVEEAMSAAPYAVEAETPLVAVAAEMARRKLGSAVVVSGARVVGVFTTIDALRALVGTPSRPRAFATKRGGTKRGRTKRASKGG